MAHKENLFSLKFRKTDSDSPLIVTLPWSQPNISSLCVMMFQPHNKLEKIWIIRNTKDEDDWTADGTIDTDKDAEFLVYGMKSVSGQHDDCFEVLIQETILMDKDKLNDKSTRSLTWNKYLFNIDILKKTLSLEEFTKLKTFTLPTNNRLDFKGEKFQGQRDIIMILEQGNTRYFLLDKMDSSGVVVPLTLPSRHTYKGLVIEIQPELKSYKTLRTSGIFTLKTAMTKEQLTQLKTKAEEFIKDSSSHEVKIMFRNKPKEKMVEIMKKHGGLMEKYTKDNNGDQYSPINGNIEGLFFSVSLDRYTNELPNFSYFGDSRLHIPVEALFADDTNLYFTDFYCHTTAHYVTVVLTKKESEHHETDAFCKENLLLLDQHDNPFLYRADDKVHTTRRLHVEVLYTENVNISKLQRQYGENVVKFTRTRACGNGQSRPEGIPKRLSCSECNL